MPLHRRPTFGVDLNLARRKDDEVSRVRRIIPPELWHWRLPVSSSSIVSVGYSPRRAQLELRFAGGSIYTYLNVDRGTYTALASATSLSRFFNSAIRGKYNFVKSSGEA